MHPRIGKIIDWLALGIVVAMVGTFLVGGFWFLGIGTPTNFAFPRTFSAQLWKQVALDDPHILGDARCRMVFDLRHRVGLEGRTRAEIFQLLGPSEDSGMREGVSTYALCLPMMDYEILELFWRDGRVVSSSVRSS